MPWPATVEGFDVSAGSREEQRRLRELEARRAKSLARARQLSDELISESDFHEILEQLVHGLLETFQANRAVTVLFEEDGRNPLLSVERCSDGSNQGEGIAEEIVERCLQVRTVLRIAGGLDGLGGLAAPLLYQGRVLGLIYFERTTSGSLPFEAEDVHLTAVIANQAAFVLGPQIMEG
jgi:GAF domain-containing protein